MLAALARLTARVLAPWTQHPTQLTPLEAPVAADTEMIARLNAAPPKVAAKLASLLDKVDALDSSIAADAQADADALRPSVEFLENLGADESTPVPSEDPVPSDPTPVDPEPAPADNGDQPAS